MEITDAKFKEIVGIVAFIVLSVPITLLARWVLGPMGRIGRRRFRVTTGDVLYLLAMILVWVAVTWSALPVLLLGAVFVLIVWFLGVASVSSLEIGIPWHRAAAITLVYPFTALGSLAVIGLGTVSISDLSRSPFSLQPSTHVLMAVFSTLIIVAQLAIARLSRRIAAENTREPAPPPPDQDRALVDDE